MFLVLVKRRPLVKGVGIEEVTKLIFVLTMYNIGVMCTPDLSTVLKLFSTGLVGKTPENAKSNFPTFHQ